MVNYKNGKIYKIISSNTEDIYIGSTTLALSKRLSKHKSCIKAGKYISSKLVIDHGNYRIILVEDCPCDNKEQLIQREQYYLDLYKDICVNNKNAFTDHISYMKDYYQLNKEILSTKRKNYYEYNRDSLNAKNKIYYQCNKKAIEDKHKQKIHCDHCDKQVRTDSLRKHKKSEYCKNYVK